MLTRSMKIVLDKKFCDPKTMMRLLMARMRGRAIACGCLPEHYAPGWVRQDSGMSTSCALGCQNHVPIDNRNLRRLNYRVAQAITVFCRKRIHTGGSFPPNIHRSSTLVSPQTVPTDWLWRNLSRQLQWFSDLRHSKRVNRVLST